MSLLTLLQPVALVLIIIVFVAEIRRIRYQVFHIIVTLHKTGDIIEKVVERIDKHRDLLQQAHVELNNIDDFISNHQDSCIEDRAPGILSEFQVFRERQGVLEENQEFDHADVERRLSQFSRRISDIRTICLRIDAELGRGPNSDNSGSL